MDILTISPSGARTISGTVAGAPMINFNGVDYVTINNCEIFDFFLTGGCAGVYALTGNTDWTITNNKIYQTATRTFTAAGTLNGIYFSNSTYGNNIQITGNTIGYANGSGTGTLTLTGSTIAGSFQGIFLTALSSAATACNINSYIISDISLTSSTGSFYGIYSGTSASSNTININTNQVKNIGLVTTTGTEAGIYSGSATTLNCNTNTIDNITRNGAGTFYGIQYSSPTTVTFNGNTIKNLSSTSTTSTSNFYGIYSGNSPGTEILIGNNLYNFTSSATGAQAIIGWYNNTASGTKTAQNNNFYNFSAAGGATLYGIRLAYGTTVEISGNSIYTFSGGATIYGIYISSGTTLNIYNNLIGDLRATAATGLNAIAGIYANSSSTYNVYYNTIYLNATSSSATTFGTSTIYFSSSATAFNMRNNILVNLSTPVQEGSNNNANGVSACLRRSGGTTGTVPANYATTSNNNDYWCNPASGTNNHLTYVEGTSTITNHYNTVAGFIGFLVNRDQVSIGVNPSFLSTTGSNATFLHVNPAVSSGIESGAVNIATYTDDFDGNVRQGDPGYPAQVNGGGGAPDIGADEYDGIPSLCPNLPAATTSVYRVTVGLDFSITTVLSWSPWDDLYSDPLATTPYAGEDMATVYSKVYTVRTYTLTSTSDAGCITTGSNTVTAVDYTVSGTLKYNNNPKTPMQNANLSLNPGGINSTDAVQMNVWNANQVALPHVKFLAGEVDYDVSTTINATDALSVQNYFVFHTSFDRTVISGQPWVMWKAGDIVLNNTYRNRLITDIPVIVVDENLTVNLYSQAIGDFSGSYTCRLDSEILQPGLYTATITVDNGTGDIVKTIKLVRK